LNDKLIQNLIALFIWKKTLQHPEYNRNNTLVARLDLEYLQWKNYFIWSINRTMGNCVIAEIDLGVGDNTCRPMIYMEFSQFSLSEFSSF